MSISAIGGSSAPSTLYATSTSSSKKKADDPMSQAIGQLQSTDPTLASKLTDLQKRVESMKKGGASEKDVQSTIKSTMDGLSSTEKSELKSAMPAPPAGGKGGPGGPPPSGPPPSSGTTDSDTDSDGASSSFSVSSLLDSASSAQNDAIMNLMSQRAASSYATA